MPTLRKDKGNCWMARVVMHGRQVACKMFPPGKKHGPEWRAAKEWEEEHRNRAVVALQTPSALERLLGWGEAYLAHAQRTMTPGTHAEKELVMRCFFTFCRNEGVRGLEDITPAKAYVYLAGLNDSKGGNVANKHRKNLMAAWAWGLDFVEDFPQIVSPFGKVRPFQAQKTPRYVPPEEDVVKVLEKAAGQDLVMLLAFYFTGARRGEVFRLTWQDVDLDAGRIRLTDHKAGNGQRRERWLQMHPELIKALSWWREARPCKVDNVFMQVHCDTTLGQPFAFRRHFMDNLCAKANVKPFGFHAIRHKSAAITFEASGLNSAQILMGHYRATTTDTYVASAGLYMDQGAIVAALGNSGIGQIVGDLMKKSFPQEAAPLGGNCNPEFVTQ